MMAWAWSVGRYWNSEVRVHVTFPLLLIYIAWVRHTSGGASAAVDAIVLVLAMFLCVLAHEYGHALAARRYGIPTPSITLLPIGGVARLARAPSGPGEEIVVAAAGPLVNVAIALALAAVLGFDIDPAADFWSPRHGFVERLAAINVFLVAFNLIPAYPLDGGRILRGLLTYVLGRARATSVASVIGRAFAGIFGLVGVVTANPFLILIAILNLAGLRRRKRRAVRSK